MRRSGLFRRGARPPNWATTASLHRITFVSIFAKLVQDDFFRNVDLGMETMQIVQVDQKFVYHKPMCVGDKLSARMDVHSVNERFGADIVVTKNTCSNEDGELVLEAYTTLMGHEGDNSIQLKWDKETGQVVRTGVISI